MVEELAVEFQLRLRPDLFQEQALAPAGVGDNDVRRIPLVARAPDAASQAGLTPNDFALEVDRPRVRLFGVPTALASKGTSLTPFHCVALSLGKD